MAAALPFIPVVFSALSSISQGGQANADAQFTASQLEQRAGQTRAAGQREAAEQRRQTRLAQSRLQALAGGGGSDPTVVNLAADIAGEGELRALTSLYGAEERATGDETQAGATRQMGKNARKAGYINAVSSVLSGGSSMYEKYGFGGFKSPAAKG